MARETRASELPANSRRLKSDSQRSAIRRIGPRPSGVSRPPLALRESHAPRNRRVPPPAPPREPAPPRVKNAMSSLWSGTSTAGAKLMALAKSAQGVWSGRLLGPANLLVRVLTIVAFLLGGGALGRFVQHHLTTAPAFALDRIEVKGLSRIERGELYEAAGLELGMNVFARSPDEVRRRLLQHPWIVSAEVERRLPSRFEIAVREREPVALLVVEACAGGERAGADEAPPCEEASSLYLISDEGKMFKRLSGKDPVDLPVVTGVPKERLARDPEFLRRMLVDAVALLHEYQNSGLGARAAIGEIHVEANDGLAVYAGEDLTYVRFGAPPFTAKLARLKRVFERLERERAHAEYVYLDNEQHPERVTVRLR